MAVPQPAVLLGLSAAEAQRRRQRFGPNELPPPHRTPAWRRFVDQLVHFFALMLWVAGALALVAGLPTLGIAIFIVIVLNAAFAFVQESRADQAAERLQALLPQRITVRRDGVSVPVEARDVVVGDLLLLEAGDRVPADATVETTHGLLVDTSLLTGESEPVSMSVTEAVLAGTFIVEGEGEATVTAIGAATRLADIARLTTSVETPDSPLTRELRRVVRLVAAIAVGVGGAFFVVSWLLGNPPQDGFIFAIGVTVALVPEALLPTVTLSLAWGAEQMAHRKVLVRHLDAVETLGSTTMICTDKTGTLTRNEMTVVRAWVPSGTAASPQAGYDPAGQVRVDEAARDDVRRMARAAARCSTGYVVNRDGAWRAHGDPMEAAMDAFARRLGVDTERDRRRPPEKRFPFDPRRRRMSVVADGEVLVKGAPDSVVPLVTAAPPASVLEEFTAAGLRVIAVAVRPLGSGPSRGAVPACAEDAECDLTLLGLLALEDPPRDDVGTAIAACRQAGIQVAMVTGDHPGTAAAIATEVGLRRADDPVHVGADLPEDDAALGELLDRDGVVIARTSPEQKLRIARALRARGHVVAMTGDGVNDGPALHEADIGIAMGESGTDVAREAADLVLLDDHFATIVGGVEQGRATFLNVRRFLTYHLTDNVAELTPFVVWALSAGHVPLALGVLQVLALDIGTDTFTAVALGAEPPARHTLERPPVKGRLLSRTVLRRSFGLLGPTESLLSMGAFFATFVSLGWRPGDPFPTGWAITAASGAAFLTVVTGQMANAFACRSSTRTPAALGWWTNRLIPLAVLAGLVISLSTLLIPPFADLLGQAVPIAVGWAFAALSPVVVLTVDALDKRLRARSRPVIMRRRVGRRG